MSGTFQREQVSGEDACGLDLDAPHDTYLSNSLSIEYCNFPVGWSRVVPMLLLISTAVLAMSPIRVAECRMAECDS